MKEKERASKVERKDMNDAQKKAERERLKEEKIKIDKDPKLFIEEVHIQSLDMFGPRVGFIKFVSVAKVRASTL